MKVGLCNLGCKVNTYEMEYIASLFKERGYEIGDFNDFCDVYVVNTCTVTNNSDVKSRKMINHPKKINKNCCLVVCGCFIESAKDYKNDDIDIILGNYNKSKVVDLVEDFFRNKEKINQRFNLNEVEFEDMNIKHFENRTRAFVKIQDGCENFCTYCIIPYARGRIRSRKMDSIREEMVRLAEKGFKEIVLTGINLGCYSDGEKTLIDVIEMADEIEGIERVRLGSLDPEVITPDFVERIGKCRKICPHFHLSLQSGCNNTLKAMNRHYTAEEYFEKCEMLRSVFENPAFTTDIIVGFPGESDEDFEASLDFAKKVEFSRIHVFKYSKRDGTVAAKMPNQVDERIKTKRSDILIATGEELVKKYNENKLGTYDFVLWEERKQINGREYWVGHTTDYVEVALETDEEQ